TAGLSQLRRHRCEARLPEKGWRRSPLMCEHVFVPGAATILHADLDAFYASVEQRDDPRLRGRPVIVGAGVVLAASYEAKARGIRTAMGGSTARRLCPDAVVVSPRMSAYSEASKAVFNVFEDMSPLVEGLSIDEAFIDARGLEHIKGTPHEIAVRLRRDVREQVGLPITVGVARTKFLAKVASGVAKPDGLLVVPPDGELAFLHPLPVERLWGVGKVTSKKLRDLGITTVAEVLRMRFDDFTRATRSHTLTEPTAQTQKILATARGLLATAMPMIERQGITLIGVALSNLEDDWAIQLALPFDGQRESALDAVLDDIRDRFGTGAITRAVLLGRDNHITVPLLPD